MTDVQMISIIFTIVAVGVTICGLVVISTVFLIRQMNMFETRLTSRLEEIR